MRCLRCVVRCLRLRRPTWLAALCALLALAGGCCRPGAAERTLTVSLPAQKWLLDSIVGLTRFTVVSMLGAGSNPETSSLP